MTMPTMPTMPIMISSFSPTRRATTLPLQRSKLTSFLMEQAMAVLDRWAAEAAKEVSSDGNRVGNIPTLGVIHAYMALILSNQTEDTMTPPVMGKFLGAMAYVRGRHAFGQVLRNIALNLEDHADQKKVERVVLDQLLRFLQSEGVDTSQLDKDHLKQFLTGEPLWYVSQGREWGACPKEKGEEPPLSMLCAVCCVLCAVCCVLCAVYCVLCTVYCVLCAVCCVLCAVCGVWWCVL